MQIDWRRDRDKLTFIICQNSDDVSSTTTVQLEPERRCQRDGTLDEESMIGDVNLFISKGDDDDSTDHSDEDEDLDEPIVGELELMIAESTSRGNGYGKAALVTFLRYILAHEREILQEFLYGSVDCGIDSSTIVNITDVKSPSATDSAQNGAIKAEAESKWFNHFTVKIGETNVKSIGLFEGLQFRKISEEPNYFGEFELRCGRHELESVVFQVFDGGTGMVKRQVLDGYEEVKYVPPRPASHTR